MTDPVIDSVGSYSTASASAAKVSIHPGKLWGTVRQNEENRAYGQDPMGENSVTDPVRCAVYTGHGRCGLLTN